MTATMDTVRYSVGSLVRVRGREWVVLPDDPDQPDTLLLRPLGGTDGDRFGLSRRLEGAAVEPATFPPPDPAAAGDAEASGLLRDAVRLALRSGAGPFRSLGRIAVEPRPYQLVPLLMALRQEPVRLLIADDVGIGKTVEAALIARELLDRGEIRRLAVLCPPHLCEQWQAELRDKFHLDAVVIRPATVARLERGLPLDRSVFLEHAVQVISVDYIKSDRRRDQFVRDCPEFVIVDEAHACADGGTVGQHQRYRLLREIAGDPDRHLVLTTATPHSGVEAAFRSLLTLLDPDFARLSEDGVVAADDPLRQRLARHFVQRRRADIRSYVDETAFPERLTRDETYRLGTDQRKLLDAVLGYARELIADTEHLGRFQQRVRWWAALALLRCVASSPAAAAATLRTRAAGLAPPGGPAGAADHPLDTDDLDAIGERTVLDLDASDTADSDDAVPGADLTDLEPGDAGRERRRLRDLALQAERLRGDGDPKLLGLVKLLAELLDGGARPIVFCRFIATADYLAAELPARLRKYRVEVDSVTGQLPPEERARRVAELQTADRRILVATDCLSEGINLQAGFDAVVHYDLAWNPTRHEQREGRVDRFGQEAPTVWTVLYTGQDNPVDAAILRVLYRKARTIRERLGVTVPIPASSSELLEAVFASLFRAEPARQLSFGAALGALDDDVELRAVEGAWDRAAERERVTRTVFSQGALRPEDVRRELDEAAAALGDHRATEAFVLGAAGRLQIPINADPRDGRAGAAGNPTWTLDLAAVGGEIGTALRERGGVPAGRLRVGFALPLPDDVTHIARTHPLVEGIATFLTDRALTDAPGSRHLAARAGAMVTAAVPTRTTLLLLRVRMHLDVTRDRRTTELLAEECVVAAWRSRPGPDGAVEWLPRADAEALLRAEPGASMRPERREQLLRQAIDDDLPLLGPALDAIARERADEVLAAHRRVRDAARATGSYAVRPVLPVDLLGCYVLLPVAG